MCFASPSTDIDQTKMKRAPSTNVYIVNECLKSRGLCITLSKIFNPIKNKLEPQARDCINEAILKLIARQTDVNDTTLQAMKKFVRNNLHAIGYQKGTISVVLDDDQDIERYFSQCIQERKNIDLLVLYPREISIMVEASKARDSILIEERMKSSEHTWSVPCLRLQ